MHQVLLLCAPFKICRYRICPVAIYVVDSLLAKWVGHEGDGDKAVDSRYDTDRLSIAQRHNWVAMHLRTRRQ